MSKQKIVTNDPKEHFTMMPNIIDESDLDPHEFRLLLHYYRVGNCWEGTRTTAKKCNMSVGTVSKKRQSLADKGWIILQKPDNSTDTITITLIDKWEENIAHFRDKTRSSGEPPVHQVNTPVHQVNERILLLRISLLKKNILCLTARCPPHFQKIPNHLKANLKVMIRSLQRC